MHMDPLIPYLTGAVIVILFIGLVLKRLRQSNVVGYILAGVLIGPSGLELLNNAEALSTASAIGGTIPSVFCGDGTADQEFHQVVASAGNRDIRANRRQCGVCGWSAVFWGGRWRGSFFSVS